MIEWTTAVITIVPICLVGLIWAAIQYSQVVKIQTNASLASKGSIQEDGKNPIERMEICGKQIQNGADVFLKQEYLFCVCWCIVMALIIYFAVDGIHQCYQTVSFLVGAFTSILCGWVAMKIATRSNFRTTYMAYVEIEQNNNKEQAMSKAFKTAFAAGVAMGFSLVSIALLIITILIVAYLYIKNGGETDENIGSLMENIAGYGLGGSTVALFGRVGGGIYTKAADVGADLVGKVEKSLEEDSPYNPATIADNVGDNVGDVAGMGSDLFGSFAESTSASLVVSGASLTAVGETGVSLDNLWYPLLVTAFGIIVCIITSLVALYIVQVQQADQIENRLKDQLLISTILLTPTIIGTAYWSVPEKFTLTGVEGELTYWHVYVCSLVGLWAGLVIGYITEYMTSHRYKPVQDVVNSCETGAATNIIYGLALGYNSTIVPIIAICVAAYVSHKLSGFYGVALSALGMLSNLPIGLAIDGYGPISDNAGGIAELASCGEEVREVTDALDAAGNTTAAIGKGFAIGSAALVSLALYGGFITRAKEWTNLQKELNLDSRHGLENCEITDPLIFAGLLLGAMLPYAFSAFTMKSVGKAAKGMVEEVRAQFEDGLILLKKKEPDFDRCIAVSTKESLKEMVAPGALVIVTPIVFGVLFGPKGLAGLLPGSLVSGVQMAISAANTGGAWDNTKKYIEAGLYKDDKGVVHGKKTDIHKAAVIGDTVGDPLKDTSGPSLNILVKLMAILSLVFAEFFCLTGVLVVPFHDYND